MTRRLREFLIKKSIFFDFQKYILYNIILRLVPKSIFHRRKNFIIYHIIGPVCVESACSDSKMILTRIFDTLIHLAWGFLALSIGQVRRSLKVILYRSTFMAGGGKMGPPVRVF